MANRIKIRHGNLVPASGDLLPNELGAYFHNGIVELYIGTDGEPMKISGSGGGGGDSDMVWYPSISDAGVISWIKSDSTNPPTAKNIMGPQGVPGPEGPPGTPNFVICTYGTTTFAEITSALANEQVPIVMGYTESNLEDVAFIYTCKLNTMPAYVFSAVFNDGIKQLYCNQSNVWTNDFIEIPSDLAQVAYTGNINDLIQTSTLIIDCGGAIT